MTLREKLLQEFTRRHPGEAAALLGDQPREGAAGILERLPEAEAAAVLERMATSEATRALALVNRERATALLTPQRPERAAALLRGLPPEGREALLATLPAAGRIRALMAYAAGTAGALMDPSVPALLAELDLAEARSRLTRRLDQLALEVHVVDSEGRPVGVADVREVLDPARRGPLVAISAPLEPVSEQADLASLGAHPGWLSHGTLPVVDGRGRYVGAVRAERMRQAAQEVVSRRSRGGSEAVRALGEVFWLGLTGLFSSLTRPETEELR